MRKGNLIIKNKAKNINSVNNFFSTWTSTFNNLVKRIAGSNRIVVGNGNVLEVPLPSLEKLVENRDRGLNLLYTENKNLAEIKIWKEERQVLLKQVDLELKHFNDTKTNNDIKNCSKRVVTELTAFGKRLTILRQSQERVWS